jgi:phosphate transport system substrate-binding protein
MTSSILRTLRPSAACSLVALAVMGGVAAAPQNVDPGLPAYAKSGDVAGNVRIVGSSAVSALLADVGDAFDKGQPKVSFNTSGDRSQDGAAALTAGSADIAALGRPMTAAERAAFQTKFGYAPTEIVFALDALAVVVPKKSPVTALTPDEVAALFGASPKGRATAKTWADVGVSDKEYAALAIEATASRSVDDLATAARSLVLGGGDFRADLRDQSTQGSIATAAAKKGGVGLLSPFFITGGVRVVPIGGVSPTSETIANGSYPFGRKLYAYVNRKSGAPLPAHVAEFLRYTLSKDGQKTIANKGGMPLTAALAADQAKSVGGS